MEVKLILNNNEFYQNAMINIRSDNDEWKNAAETCSANLIEKTITENGEYNAKEDGADGYSSVTVNVPSVPTFTAINVPGLPKTLTLGTPNTDNDNDIPSSIWVCRSEIGDYSVMFPKRPQVSFYAICYDPLVKMQGFSDDYNDHYIIFTPAQNYDGFYSTNQRKISMSGATVTPGDGKVYCAYIRYITTTYGSLFKIEKYDIDFTTILR